MPFQAHSFVPFPPCRSPFLLPMRQHPQLVSCAGNMALDGFFGAAISSEQSTMRLDLGAFFFFFSPPPPPPPPPPPFFFFFFFPKGKI